MVIAPGAVGGPVRVTNGFVADAEDLFDFIGHVLEGLADPRRLFYFVGPFECVVLFVAHLSLKLLLARYNEQSGQTGMSPLT